MKPCLLNLLCLAIVFVVSYGAFGQAPPPVTAQAVIAAKDLQADVEILRRAYEALHPGLYRYNTKQQMDAELAALSSEFATDQTLQQAYLKLSIFLAKVKCGHTYANFFNQRKAVAQALFQRQDKLPFYFRWVGEKMILTRDFSDNQTLKPGREIVSINGIAAKDILKKLMTIARADGSNDAKRVNYLEVQGIGEYEAFDVFYPMFFPMKDAKFDLTIKSPGAKRAQKISVVALTYEQRLAPVKAAVKARRGTAAAVWELKFLNDKTAYLKMPSWAMYSSKWDWRAFIQNSMDTLVQRKTPNFIIDLRGNEGGLDVGDVILSRVIKQDLRIERSPRMVRYQSVPEDLRPYLDTWDKSFMDWGTFAVQPEEGPKDGFFRMTKFDDDAQGDVIKATGERYTGRLFVLIDASNSSGTFQFNELVQRNKLATLVGQPTGGNQRGINGGAFFFLRLPNSKIEADLPLIARFPANKPDAGILPDVYVRPDIKDIGAGIDTELRAVLGLMK